MNGLTNEKARASVNKTAAMRCLKRTVRLKMTGYTDQKKSLASLADLALFASNLQIFLETTVLHKGKLSPCPNRTKSEWPSDDKARKCAHSVRRCLLWTDQIVRSASIASRHRRWSGKEVPTLRSVMGFLFPNKQMFLKRGRDHRIT